MKFPSLQSNFSISELNGFIKFMNYLVTKTVSNILFRQRING